MTTETLAQLELLFEEEVYLTSISEFGISWDDFSSGNAPIPHEGARFDLSFEGQLEGPDIRGKISGIDFLEVRADGRFMLNIYATIITDDGFRIALYEDGVLTPVEGSFAELRLNLKFTTAHEKYQWLNKRQVWALGKVNMETGKVNVKAFATKPE